MTVAAPDNTRAQLQGCKVRPAGVTSVCFTEDVTGIDNETAVVHPRRQTAATPIGGTWQCADASGAAADCQSGHVRAARFTPTTPVPVPLAVALNPEHTLGITDLGGNSIFTY